VTSTSRAKNILLVQRFLIDLRSLFRLSRSPGDKHFSCQKYFAGPIVSHRAGTGLSPRLRWFRLGRGRVELQLPMPCSSRSPNLLISLHVAAAQMVLPLLGIRPAASPRRISREKASFFPRPGKHPSTSADLSSTSAAFRFPYGTERGPPKYVRASPTIDIATVTYLIQTTFLCR